MNKELLNAKEVSELTGLKTARIYELTRTAQIPFILVGQRQYRYPKRRILGWCLGEKPESADRVHQLED